MKRNPFDFHHSYKNALLSRTILKRYIVLLQKNFSYLYYNSGYEWKTILPVIIFWRCLLSWLIMFKNIYGFLPLMLYFFLWGYFQNALKSFIFFIVYDSEVKIDIDTSYIWGNGHKKFFKQIFFLKISIYFIFQRLFHNSIFTMLPWNLNLCYQIMIWWNKRVSLFTLLMIFTWNVNLAFPYYIRVPFIVYVSKFQHHETSSIFTHYV